MTMHSKDPINFVAYRQQGVNNSPRVGHLDVESQSIQPLSFNSGTPVENLYQVIVAGVHEYIAADPVLSVQDVKLLPPISGRDVLAVGKNYMEHAKEFNSSGYDSSDKVDLPSHPVIFTKRATSIVAHGDEIHIHDGFTESADFEGEIGVIVGKSGYRIHENEAWKYVWGYTIINDVTARERQRDHKQFYIGKSADTFCPMGPSAVRKEDLPDWGRSLRLQTHVNGELRQDATARDLIFSIPHLISTLSAGQTLQPGDVIATGTPAGVGIGRVPPVFLKPGDEIAVTISGLGTLRNRVADHLQLNPTELRIQEQCSELFRLENGEKSRHGQFGLQEKIGRFGAGHQRFGVRKDPIILIHSLGGTKDYWLPLISTLELEKSASVHVYDLAGHGLTPTHSLQTITVDSLTQDLSDVLGLVEAEADVTSPPTLIAHSFGCLVAIKYALAHPGNIKKLVLLGPPPLPLLPSTKDHLASTVALARSQGLSEIIEDVVASQVSGHTKKNNPLAVAAVRLSLAGQDPEAYAKVCSAFASAGDIDLKELNVETLLVTGQEDSASSPAVVEEYARKINGSRQVVLPNVGHWHVFEDLVSVAESLREFL
ncbi:hypothetical protein CORC01_04870 [Colletotrichum orchidophilum]|uniref:Fumarylacetoacetate hydrolase n=1 Tax=Colletotrichum orchidophilum TaxID=1209926 RepID=A0A1G4BE84_9PEZI|nr:uncharacterized protein CORC01_04870 [Colletotrichum orchidophilum]OHE99734.1 hypothetical protein CORC01_04870 [Colletotrichum orchidophilum]